MERYGNSITLARIIENDTALRTDTGDAISVVHIDLLASERHILPIPVRSLIDLVGPVDNPDGAIMTDRGLDCSMEI